jgi:hypothetical protein
MKKTTQTFLLVFSTLLLLVSVTGSAQGQPTPQPTPRERQPPTGSAQDRRRGNGVSFSGTWNTVTDKGKTIVMTLRLERSDSSVVTGSYSVNGLTGSYKPSDGSINGFVKVSWSAEPVLQNMSSIRGTVTGNVLRFTWAEDGGGGAGRFTLSSDGESFEGTFSRTNNPDDTSGGTWNGTRQHSFAGAWQGKLGEEGLELTVQQSGDRVTGQFNINSNRDWIFKDGIVVGNTLRFTVVLSPEGLMRLGKRPDSPDQPVGVGELVMSPGGKSFQGTILGAAASGTHVGR